MSENKHRAWVQHLDGISHELLTMAIACDVTLREPGVIERVLKNDDSVCGKNNPAAFRKMRNLLMAVYKSLNIAIDRIGPEDTRMITDAIIQRIDELRSLGGSSK